MPVACSCYKATVYLEAVVHKTELGNEGGCGLSEKQQFDTRKATGVLYFLVLSSGTMVELSTRNSLAPLRCS